jgi:hypothetical protein
MVEKGKNYSKNNAFGKRKISDFYETPYSMTQQLLDSFPEFDKNALTFEPACGNGAIVDILDKNQFLYVHGTDLSKGDDFFNCTDSCPYIITNPPYSVSHQWILKCKEVCTDMFALLLPLSYLHGQKRYEEIYTDKIFSLYRIYVFTRYPMLGLPLRDDGKYPTGMQVYAWFIWKKGYLEFPTIHWINNNRFVIGNKDV